MARSRFVCLAVLLTAAGCGDDDDDDGSPDPDSGVDSGLDSGLDAGPDAAPDSGVDAGPICGRLARQRIASDLRWPVLALAPPGDDRIFYIERLDGRVIILDENEQPLAEPFLSVSDETNSGGFEGGLLSLAFHPQYADNGLVYASFTTQAGTLRVVRFTVPPETPDAVDPASETTVIDIPVPEAHHNVAGVLEFGPDGMLYIGVGDQLSEGNGQDLQSLAGKILRIDIDAPKGPYAIPPDNPFVGAKNVLPEIWAYGLREPYRIDFDPDSDALYVSDVGEDLYEEVMVVPAGSPGGADFGWATTEGPDCHTPRVDCNTAGIFFPTYHYSHEEGLAVIGASVYRGAALPACWQGRYFFGDYPTGWVRTLRWNEEEGAQEVETHAGLDDGTPFVSFGLDGHGEILIVGEETLDRIVAVEE